VPWVLEPPEKLTDAHVECAPACGARWRAEAFRPWAGPAGNRHAMGRGGSKATASAGKAVWAPGQIWPRPELIFSFFFLNRFE
jgi:hypothetical protein